ncbi:MAG TPA: two-component regulator propeller domain-containing protein, partial [Verrucomicrobiae bacterium]
MKLKKHSTLPYWLRLVRTAFPLLLLLFHAGAVKALNPSRGFAQYNCRTWNRQNGLPASRVSAVAQTKDGYLWLGTAAGLIRFDGSEFKVLDLTRERQVRIGIITSLARSERGGLWVGFQNSGFGYYDKQKFSYRGRDAWGGVDANLRNLGESENGSIWLATERDVFRISPKEDAQAAFSQYTNFAGNVIRGFEDAQGRLWIGTANDGVFCWHHGKTELFPAMGSDPADAIAQDAEGRLWFGTYRGLRCFDGDGKPVEIPAFTNAIRALLVDQHNVLWIGTENAGLARYQNGQCTYLQKADGLASDSVSALAEDSFGNLWVGTADGISELSDVKFPTILAAGNPYVKDATCVAASRQDGIWIGSAAGASFFDESSQTYTLATGLPLDFVKRIYEARNGDLYVVCGTTNLVILSGGKMVAQYLPETQVVGMAEDAQSVVVSVGGELYRASTNSLIPFQFSGESPQLWWVYGLTAGHDGSLWAGCANGICHITNGAFQQWTTEQGLTDGRVNFIAEDDDGTIWAAMLSTGIARLKDGRIRCISRQDGLFDNNVYAIVPDKFGNLWMDSGRGVFRASRQDLNDFADGKQDQIDCIAYDGPEAVKSVDKSWLQEHVGCQSRDGRIWFPNANGVVMIDPADIPTNPIAPPVFIDLVRANGGNVAGGDHCSVPPGRGELEFHFSAVSFNAPEKTRFRYRLDGYDKDWVSAAGRRVAQYANLGPGSYVFHVAAANADGVWNSTGDSVAITLRPHYYQARWFYFAVAGVVLAALGSVYFLRIRHLKRRENALQKARDQLETEVQKRTLQLADANSTLKIEVDGHKATMAELAQRTRALESEIEERKRMQAENENVQRQLLETSRQAGMAEVATSVLHNVGNVLNSVNVSAHLLAELLDKSKTGGVARMANLLAQNRADLARFLCEPGRADQVIDYLKAL